RVVGVLGACAKTPERAETVPARAWYRNRCLLPEGRASTAGVGRFRGPRRAVSRGRTANAGTAGLAGWAGTERRATACGGRRSAWLFRDLRARRTARR